VVTAGARRREVRATPHLMARLRAGTDIANRCASGLSRMCWTTRSCSRRDGGRSRRDAHPGW